MCVSEINPFAKILLSRILSKWDTCERQFDQEFTIKDTIKDNCFGFVCKFHITDISTNIYFVQIQQ